jgi:hypothetical protein
MHVERLCDALAWLLARYSSDLLINVSTGQEVSIGELGQKIGAIVGLSGRIAFDATTPDGMPRKLLASSRILTIGWRPSVDLDQGPTGNLPVVPEPRIFGFERSARRPIVGWVFEALCYLVKLAIRRIAPRATRPS